MGDRLKIRIALCKCQPAIACDRPGTQAIAHPCLPQNGPYIAQILSKRIFQLFTKRQLSIGPIGLLTGTHGINGGLVPPLLTKNRRLGRWSLGILGSMRGTLTLHGVSRDEVIGQCIQQEADRFYLRTFQKVL